MDEVVKKPNDLPQAVPTVGTSNKESGVRTPYVEGAEQGKQIRQEIQEFVKPSEPPVPHHPEVGIIPAAESTPMPKWQGNPPMTEAQLEEIVKNEKSSSAIQEHIRGEYQEKSIFGWAATMLKALKRIHGKLTGQPA